MKTLMNTVLGGALALGMSQAALAETQGVTDDEIVIGSVNDLSGIFAAVGVPEVADGDSWTPALESKISEVSVGASLRIPGWRNKLAIDLSRLVREFAADSDAVINGELHAPLRPKLPALIPGTKYLLEIVVRTTGVGHHLTQGTSDSNQLWLDVTATAGERIIGRSGAREIFQL